MQSHILTNNTKINNNQIFGKFKQIVYLLKIKRQLKIKSPHKILDIPEKKYNNVCYVYNITNY